MMLSDQLFAHAKALRKLTSHVLDVAPSRSYGSLRPWLHVIDAENYILSVAEWLRDSGKDEEARP
ncbi:MAG: hypothetical protein ABIH23_04970 [bacterium]